MSGFQSVGLHRTAKHEYYWNGRGPLINVTGVVGTLDKSGPLVGWAKRETAACAVRNLDMLGTMIAKGGPEATIKWLSAIPDFQRDTAADLGTAVHARAEDIAKGRLISLTAEEAPFVAAYQRFREDWQPAYVAVEFMVCSLRYGYGGTGDLLAVIDGELWCIDLKTGKNVYSETGLQLAGLGYADFIGKPGDPVQYPIPKVKRWGVLHLRPDGYQLVPFKVTRATHRAFLQALRLRAWADEDAKRIMERPLMVKTVQTVIETVAA